MSAPDLLELDAPPPGAELDALDDAIRAALARGINPQQVALELDVELADIVRVVGAAP